MVHVHDRSTRTVPRTIAFAPSVSPACNLLRIPIFCKRFLIKFDENNLFSFAFSFCLVFGFQHFFGFFSFPIFNFFQRFQLLHKLSWTHIQEHKTRNEIENQSTKMFRFFNWLFSVSFDFHCEIFCEFVTFRRSERILIYNGNCCPLDCLFLKIKLFRFDRIIRRSEQFTDSNFYPIKIDSKRIFCWRAALLL